MTITKPATIVAVCVLFLCTVQCDRKRGPTDGDGTTPGPTLLQDPSYTKDILYYYDTGANGGPVPGIYRLDLSSPTPKPELIRAWAEFPSISESGRKLAYVLGGLRVRDMESGADSLVAPGDVTLSRWYRGDDTLVYTVYSEGIFVVDISRKEPHQIYPRQGMFADPCPDGRIVFSRYWPKAVTNPDSITFNTMLLDGTGETSVTAFRGYDVVFPQFSSDCDVIMYSQFSGIYDIRTINIVTKHATTLPVRNIGAPPELTADDRIVFAQLHSTDGKKNGQIWIMNLDGSDLHALTTWEIIRK